LLCVIYLSACTSVSEKKNDTSDASQNAPFNSLDGSRFSLASVTDKERLESSHRSKPNVKIDYISKFYSDLPDCDMNSFSLKELAVDEVRISNNDLSTIATTLNIMSYNILDLQRGDAGLGRYSCEDLPIVVMPFQPQDLKLSFNSQVGGAGVGNSANIGSLGKSNAADLDRFLVYYHPKQPEKFDKLKWLVANKLDVPAAQVYIETMVLEVREEDSEEFGIQYDKADGDKLFSLGNLVPGGNTFDYVRDSIVDTLTGARIFTPGIGKRLRIKALVDEGKAEVLSRPSVLALSNRQALIQIVDVIQAPELSSTLSQTGGLQVSSYHFTPLLIGITLNLKPRVSADRKWLTLEIDATVETEDDENNGQVYASTPDGNRVLLAEKQGSSSKKVRTFARIPDRTPIIIGGLVSKKVEKRQGKLLGLSDIPVLGKLFTSKDDEIQKREVIIVLTPYILAEDSTGVAINQPNPEMIRKSTESTLGGSE
jgi:general secretion pathway protein D